MTHATSIGVTTCVAVPFSEHDFDRSDGWYKAKVGDRVWDWKMGEGHVIDRIASCATDTRYCGEDGYLPHDHEDVPMCECGRLWLADHHWTLMP